WYFSTTRVVGARGLCFGPGNTQSRPGAWPSNQSTSPPPSASMSDRIPARTRICSAYGEAIAPSGAMATVVVARSLAAGPPSGGPHGHRSYAAGVRSGLDSYLNDASALATTSPASQVAPSIENSNRLRQFAPVSPGSNTTALPVTWGSAVGAPSAVAEPATYFAPVGSIAIRRRSSTGALRHRPRWPACRARGRAGPRPLRSAP